MHTESNIVAVACISGCNMGDIRLSSPGPATPRQVQMQTTETKPVREVVATRFHRGLRFQMPVDRLKGRHQCSNTSGFNETF